jgi:hypothetical protein
MVELNTRPHHGICPPPVEILTEEHRSPYRLARRAQTLCFGQTREVDGGR